MLTKQQLVDDLASACKPQKDWRIGCEHEVFLFDAQNKRLTYDGNPGIRRVLERFKDDHWDFVCEGGNIIGLSNSVTCQSISLEPGGQFEFADCPQKNLHDVFNAHNQYWAKLDQIADDLGVSLKYQGFDDITPIEQVPWMPKGRYAIMKAHMNEVGTRGLWMMTKTCTVQVSLDFSSESDMVRKFRVSMALQPIVSALFANSEFTDDNVHFQGYRTHIWQNTDQSRCGILPFVFEDNFGFEKYVDYVLSVPMYFMKRDHYLDCRGGNFRDFMEGKLAGHLADYATLNDWKDQLTIPFPEVRLKYYLEQRGADCGSRPFIMALPSLWVGLLYDEHNLNVLADMIQEWSVDDIIDLYQSVPTKGLNAAMQGKKAIEIGKWLVDLAREGLERRTIQDAQGVLETIYLDVDFFKSL